MTMHTGLRAAAFAGAIALTSPAALAQNAGTGNAGTDTGAAGPTANLVELDDDQKDITWNGLSIDALEDKDVYGPKGEKIGEVEEVLGDGTGKVAALVIETEEGFLGLGERDAVVQMDQLKLDSEQDRIVLNISKSELEGLPRWNK